MKRTHARAGDRVYNVDFEDKDDPYGYGIGYVLTVLAKDRNEAKRKVNAYGKHLGGTGRAFRASLDKKAIL